MEYKEKIIKILMLARLGELGVWPMSSLVLYYVIYYIIVGLVGLTIINGY